MATQLVIYKTADKVIYGYIKKHDGADYDWDNESSYATDKEIYVDGKRRLFELDSDYEVRDFSGSLPGDFIESLEGDYTDPDPENHVAPTPEKYKFDATFENIVANT